MSLAHSSRPRRAAPHTCAPSGSFSSLLCERSGDSDPTAQRGKGEATLHGVAQLGKGRVGMGGPFKPQNPPTSAISGSRTPKGLYEGPPGGIAMNECRTWQGQDENLKTHHHLWGAGLEGSRGVTKLAPPELRWSPDVSRETVMTLSLQSGTLHTVWSKFSASVSCFRKQG